MRPLGLQQTEKSLETYEGEVFVREANLKELLVYPNFKMLVISAFRRLLGWGWTIFLRF